MQGVLEAYEVRGGEERIKPQVLTGTYLLGILFGTGAFSFSTRASAESPFLTIFHAVWTG